jgi:carbon starvation protein CstA
MKKLFNVENFELGMMLVILVYCILALMSVVGWKLIILIPIIFVTMFVAGFVAKHVILLIEKLKNK